MTATAAHPTPAPASSAEAVIQCAGLTKVFRDFWLRNKVRAVDSIDLEVRRGQVFGLLGPNGSGKSTTIKMILGLLYPTAGRISVLGKRPEDVATKRLIGYLPEESYLYRFLNARETLDYYGRLFSIPRRTRMKRIDELLEQVGLVHAQHRPVGQYSKGMQRKIGLAQALINRPQLLILDEPTSGMDPTATHDTKKLLQYLCARGTTILMCSHLLADAEELCQHVAMMYGGKIIRQGTVEELLTIHNRTTIETEHLDDQSIAQIDQLLLARGRKIEAVSHPRQSLEQWFIERIEEQQARGAATSGAVSGGKMAEFLGGPEAEGQDVIGKLVQSPKVPTAPTSATAKPAKPAAPPPDDALIKILTKSQGAGGGGSKEKPAALEGVHPATARGPAAPPAPPGSAPAAPAPPAPRGAAPPPVAPMAESAAAAFDQPPTAEELSIIDSLVNRSWTGPEKKGDAPAAPGPPSEAANQVEKPTDSTPGGPEKAYGGFLDALSRVKPEDEPKE